MILCNPEYMELHQWADATMMIVGQYSCVTGLQGDDWQSWGQWVFKDPRLAKYNPPEPRMFDDWRQWGKELSEAFNAAPESPHA